VIVGVIEELLDADRLFDVRRVLPELLHLCVVVLRVVAEILEHKANEERLDLRDQRVLLLEKEVSQVVHDLSAAVGYSRNTIFHDVS